MREIIKPAFVLFIITAVSALCLGFVYEITKEPIERAQAAEKAKALTELFPQASEFKEEISLPEEGLEIGYALVTEALTAYDNTGAIGYVISAEAGGYGGPIKILSAINADGSIAGISVISSSETPGLGANASDESFTGQYKNKSGVLRVTKSAPAENEIAAITSATITTQAITDAVNSTLEFFNENLKGGA